MSKLFSKLYSAYYNTVAKIITASLDGLIDDTVISDIIRENAFSESMLTIPTAIKSRSWPFFRSDNSCVLKHAPSMPLTTLQKRWLKALLIDPRIKLFDIQIPNLECVEPLFTQDDYKIYDAFNDGDPFDDESYIENFRFIAIAIKSNTIICVNFRGKDGFDHWARVLPKKFEYSPKDDKIRVLADGVQFGVFRLSRVYECRSDCSGERIDKWWEEDSQNNLMLLIDNKRNALERAMLHFAHFEKQVERRDEAEYLVRLKYHAHDENELVIRVLSFGPMIKVLEPQSFIGLIKKRLLAQKNLGLT